MSVQINKEITTVQVEVPKTNVAIENAVTQITVQTSTPQITISTAGVNGKDGIIQDLSNYAVLSGSNLFLGEQSISGSFTHIGLQFNEGDIVTTGSLKVSGSTIQIGNNTQIGNNILSGSTTQIGNNILTGTTTLNGSFDIIGTSVFTGSITLSSGSALNINDGFYINGNKQFNYGQWVSLQTQTGSANTAYPMKFETQIDGASGIRMQNNLSGFPTRLTADNTGMYNIQFSAQLHTTSTEAVDFSVWFAMTGSNIQNSNTDFSVEKIAGGGYGVAALNFMTPITAGDYVELYWSKTTNNGQLQYKGTQSVPTRPATPSIIVTVTQVA